jgi:hypothetical protein
MFNSLKYAKMLMNAGVPREAAETQIEIMSDMMQDNFSTKQDVKDLGVALRSEMQEMNMSLRAEMQETASALRAEMRELGASLRGEMKDVRMEVQKLEYRMTIKMGSMMTVLLSLTIAILKLS